MRKAIISLTLLDQTLPIPNQTIPKPRPYLTKYSPDHQPRSQPPATLNLTFPFTPLVTLNNKERNKRKKTPPSQCDIPTKEGLLTPAAHCDAAILLPIIIQWIRPGTEIWSDMWAAYRGLAAQGFQHGTVNHTLHFVNPATNVTTNRVEAMWQRSKVKFKAMFGPTNREMIPYYLSEFMWAQRFKKTLLFSLLEPSCR